MKCSKCGIHDGSWFNNRNSDIYCSSCVGDVRFEKLKQVITNRLVAVRTAIKDHESEYPDIVKRYQAIQMELERILAEVKT